MHRILVAALCALLPAAAPAASGFPACVAAGLCEAAAAAAPPPTLSVGPDAWRPGGAARVESRALLRSFYNVSRPPHKAKVSGRLTTLAGGGGGGGGGGAAAHHFSVLPPLHGCGAARGAPVSDLAAAFVTRRHFPLRLQSAAAPSAATAVWLTSSVFGCRVAANGGLFDTRTFDCHGNLVASAGARVHAVSAARGAVLGLAGGGGGGADDAGRLFTGYLADGDIAALKASAVATSSAAAALRAWLAGGPAPPSPPPLASPPAANILALVPGLVWLVRNGASEVGSLTDVASGASAPLRAEDMRIQESGSAQYFATAPSGRAAIGIDSAGQLTLATVDGRTDWLGLDLATFATWLVRAGGLVQAINLDGGASVTLLHDGRAANVPSYSCMEPGARGSWGRPAARSASGKARGADDPDFKCSRPVSSGVCIHDDPLAPVTSSAGRLSLAAGGCVCFDADGGDDSFTLDEVRGMVDLDGRGRRLREAAWDAALAEEDTRLPPAARRLAGGSASPADAIILPLPEPLFMPRTRDALLAQVATLAAAAGRPVALRGLDPVCLCTSDATVGHAGGGGGDGHTVSARAHFMLHRLSLSERRARWLAALRELRLPASAQLPEWPPYAGEVDTEESRRDGAGLGAAPRASAAASSGGYRAWAALALVGALCAGVGAGGCRGRGRRAGKAATY